MSDRLNRIRILAGTWELAQPALRAPAPAAAGFVVSQPTACRTCHGAGRLLGPIASRQACHRCRRGESRPHNCRQCPVCHGNGLALIDPYDELQVQLEEGLPDERGRPSTRPFAQPQPVDGPTRAETLERRIARQLLIAAGRWDEAYASERPDYQAITLAAQQAGGSVPAEMWASGDYAPFGMALGWLRAEWPGRAGFFIGGYVDRRYSSFGSKAQARADVGLVLVASRMPARVRVPRFLEPAVANGLRKTNLWRGRHPSTAQQRAERDAEIRRRVAAGESPTKLGQEFALERRQVQRIASAGAPVATGPVAA